MVLSYYYQATGHTPFSLVYGSEVVLPVKIGVPSTRITYYSHEENENEKRINIDLLPKIRGNALMSSIAEKQRITRPAMSKQGICKLETWYFAKWKPPVSS